MPQVIAEGAVKDDTDELIIKIEAKVDDDVISSSLSLPPLTSLSSPYYHVYPLTLLNLSFIYTDISSRISQ